MAPSRLAGASVCVVGAGDGRAFCKAPLIQVLSLSWSRETSAWQAADGLL